MSLLEWSERSYSTVFGSNVADLTQQTRHKLELGATVNAALILPDYGDGYCRHGD